MDERSKLLYQNANTLRIHQDNLRWTISGAYITFVASVVYVWTKGDLVILKCLPSIAPAALFVLGHCFLIILSIESWYYNAYSLYISYCEENKGELQTFHEFIEPIRETITPFHLSFFFVLALFAVCNAFWLCLALRSIPGFPHVIFAVIYLLSVGAACRYWDYVYDLFLWPLKNIFSPRSSN